MGDGEVLLPREGYEEHIRWGVQKTGYSLEELREQGQLVRGNNKYRHERKAV
jgi:hypothetical protein